MSLNVSAKKDVLPSPSGNPREARKRIANINSLICDPDNRLGRLGGAHEIRQHIFFRDVPWDDLRRLRAPFEPKLTSNVDVQYFPIDEIDQTDTSAVLRAQTAQQGEDVNADINLPFIGYTYKRFDAFRGA